MLKKKILFLKTQNSIGTVTLCNLPHNDFLLKLQLHDKRFYTVQRFCSLPHNCLEVENRLGIIFKQQIFIGCSTKILQDKLQGPMDMLHFREPDSTLCNASYMTLLITLRDFMMARHILPLAICL